MPRLKSGNPAVGGLKRSVFSQLAERIGQQSGPIYPLHVGDTTIAPPAGAHLSDQTAQRYPEVHRYANPRGWRPLVEAIVEARQRIDGSQATSADRVLVTAGATGALCATVRALLAPGQQLLVLAPYWPLIRGMSVSHDIDVVELPFYDRIADKASAESLLESAVDPDTAAIYVNWPNNPTGVVSPPDVVQAVVDFACRHDLWIFSDEVYEPFVYRGKLTLPTAFPQALDRTIRVHSFSKAFGMAGNRVGYLLGPPDAVKRIGQLATYLVYSANTGGQIAAERALTLGEDWLRDTAARYAEIGDRAAARLGEPPPDGSTFLLIDVADALDHRGMLGFLEDCLDDGLLLAPGEVFGADYTGFVRLCFTSAEPDQIMAGVEVLARRLSR